MIFFVFRYGIRGFVFAELLHSPLIGIAALVLLFTSLWATWGMWTFREIPSLTRPLLNDAALGINYASPWLFAAHVLVLNSTQVVCSEHHWFRLWLLGKKELRRQPSAAGTTAGLWLVMLPIGFLAVLLTPPPGAPGEPTVAALLTAFPNMSVIIGFIFWMGATAALFSTTDTQIYSALLVSRFDPVSGTLADAQITPQRSLRWSLSLSLLFAGAYAGVRALNIPLEKIIFAVVPFCTVLFPAFLHFRYGKNVRFAVLATSVTGYLIMIGIGFAKPALNFYFTLSAVFVPVAIGYLTLPAVRSR